METNKNFKPEETAPLHSLDQWEEDILSRYPEPEKPAKTRDAYRNYETPERDTVREFYRLNHRYQTYDFVLEKEREFLKFDKREMPVWGAMEYLNTLVDDSDPDTDLDQLQHLLQASGAIRTDGHPDWFVLTGFLDDLGKVLCLFGEPQWAVVGDPFPVGCRHTDKIVYPEFFRDNSDYYNEGFNPKYGIYQPHCGLRNVHMSWGHDEYLDQLTRDYLPGPVYDPVPLLLRPAPRKRLRSPARRPRPGDVQVGTEIQSVRFVFQEPHAAKRCGAEALTTRI